MIYIVLGMHKSGTTLISQILHESGINMGIFNESLNYDQDNKYERHSIQEINRQLLDGFLIPPLKDWTKRKSRYQYDRAGYLRNSDSIALVRFRRFIKKYRHYTPHRLLETINDLNKTHPNWGFKDPRTCLTYSIWSRVLPEHRLVIIYRHYNQLLRHYHIPNWNIIRFYRVLYSWSLHNKMIYRHLTQTNQKVIVLNYEKLMMEDEEFDRFEEFMELELTDAREPSLYRRRNQESDLLMSRFMRFLIPFLPADPDLIYKMLEEKK